jgi:copper ion binding protein
VRQRRWTDHPLAISKENLVLNQTPRTFVGTTTFQVTGMTCGHCQRAVIAEIGEIRGVTGVVVDLDSGNVTVTADEPVDRADVAAAVDEAGYALIP